MDPNRIAEDLRGLADEIDGTRSPSRRRCAARLRKILSAINWTADTMRHHVIGDDGRAREADLDEAYAFLDEWGGRDAGGPLVIQIGETGHEISTIFFVYNDFADKFETRTMDGVVESDTLPDAVRAHREGVRSAYGDRGAPDTEWNPMVLSHPSVRGTIQA